MSQKNYENLRSMFLQSHKSGMKSANCTSKLSKRCSGIIPAKTICSYLLLKILCLLKKISDFLSQPLVHFKIFIYLCNKSDKNDGIAHQNPLKQ